MESFFAERRFALRITMEMSSNETIKQAVMAGMGLSFLSLHTIGLEVRSGLLRRRKLRVPEYRAHPSKFFGSNT